MGIKWKMDIPYILGAELDDSTDLDVVIPSEVKGIPVKIINPFLFGNTKIRSLFIPASVEVIEKNAFARCKNLKTIQIEKGSHLKTIAEEAFFDAGIDNFPFEQCEELQTIQDLAFSGTNIKQVDLSKTQISEIPMGCFTYSLVEKVIFPKNLSCINTSAFNGSKLKSVDFSNLENDLFIKDAAFTNCHELEKVTFSDKKTVLGESSFRGCSCLKKLVIPKNVELGSSCFLECTSLKTVIFEEGTPSNTRIPYQAFANCTQLKEVTIKADYEIIDMGAFWNCCQLSSIQFPKTLITIGAIAFRYCTNLKVIDLTACCMQYLCENCFDMSGIRCLNDILLDYSTGVHMAQQLNSDWGTISYDDIKDKYPFAIFNSQDLA